MTAPNLCGKTMEQLTAPDFELPATGGTIFKLCDCKGRGVVLYFYPKDNTPGCTTEGQDFAALHAQFQALDWEIFGISRDSLKAHENFKAKFCFPFELLADVDEKACELYGVMKLKKLYGKEVRGIERSTFAIAPDGRIARAWRGVKVPDHAQEVLAYVQSL